MHASLISGLFQEYQAGCARLCSLVGIFQVERIITAIGDTEQGTGMCGLASCFFEAAGIRCDLVYTQKTVQDGNS